MRIQYATAVAQRSVNEARAEYAVAAKHRHCGIELDYVLEGTLVIVEKGKPLSEPVK